MGGDLPKEARKSLREAAEPVRQEAQDLFSRISAESAAGYRVRVRARGVAVEQSRKRTTGRRPDFGRRQMGVALIPALEKRSNEVVRGLEKMLDDLSGSNGFN